MFSAREQQDERKNQQLLPLQTSFLEGKKFLLRLFVFFIFSDFFHCFVFCFAFFFCKAYEEKIFLEEISSFQPSSSFSSFFSLQPDLHSQNRIEEMFRDKQEREIRIYKMKWKIRDVRTHGIHSDTCCCFEKNWLSIRDRNNNKKRVLTNYRDRQTGRMREREREREREESKKRRIK